MNLIKSFTFLTFLITWTIVMGLVGLLSFLSFSNKFIKFHLARLWAKGVINYIKCIHGVKVEIEGQENLPSKPFILACKHQSAWETCFLLSHFSNPAYILKKELTRIPIYGWYMQIMGMIPIERGKASAIKKIIIKAKEVFNHGRVLIIFPEGTRVCPDLSVDYKPGIYMIHKAFPQIPIVPAALNSGICWPKSSFALKSGTIKLKFLPVLVGNHNKKDLLSSLKKIIDTESNKLCNYDKI